MLKENIRNCPLTVSPAHTPDHQIYTLSVLLTGASALTVEVMITKNRYCKQRRREGPGEKD